MHPRPARLIVYADTSALVKLVLLESSPAEMTALQTVTPVLASAATASAELRAALPVAYRDRRLPQLDLATAKRLLERVWAATSRLSIYPALIQEAGALAEQDERRGYGAVHLAALIRLRPPDVVDRFAGWESELRTAARDQGYRLFPI
ncbi:MAG: type II toxin-antitoxin system VapC family toxin [Candidatus Dormibacteria bacterium]